MLLSLPGKEGLDALVAPNGILHATHGDEIVEADAALQGGTYQCHLVLHLCKTAPHHIEALVNIVDVRSLHDSLKHTDVRLGIDVQERL